MRCEFNNSASFVDCGTTAPFHNITRVGINCTAMFAPQNASFNLTNHNTGQVFFLNQVTTDNSTGLFIYDNPDVAMITPGQYRLNATCYNDSAAYPALEYWTFTNPGQLDVFLTAPYNDTSQNITAPNSSVFVFNATVRCSQGYCGNVTAVLDPIVQDTAHEMTGQEQASSGQSPTEDGQEPAASQDMSGTDPAKRFMIFLIIIFAIMAFLTFTLASRRLGLIVSFALLLLLLGCNEVFTSVSQPTGANQDDAVRVNFTVSSTFDPNPGFGTPWFAANLPTGWTFINGTYSGAATGTLSQSVTPTAPSDSICGAKAGNTWIKFIGSPDTNVGGSTTGVLYVNATTGGSYNIDYVVGNSQDSWTNYSCDNAITVSGAAPRESSLCMADRHSTPPLQIPCTRQTSPALRTCLSVMSALCPGT
jgi:hypothetical protein